jgi:hypothetical protein
VAGLTPRVRLTTALPAAGISTVADPVSKPLSKIRGELTAVFGIEGPAWSLPAATERHTGESPVGSPMFESALTAARMAEPHPELPAASSHLLALGRRPA